MALADELDQYFSLLEHWNDLLRSGGFHRDGNAMINEYLTGRTGQSRHGAVAAAIALFNRFSEECLDPRWAKAGARDPVLKRLLLMCAACRDLRLTDA